MKQEMNGQKIQNWHRPLRASEPKQRFLAQRHDDPGLMMRGNSVVEEKAALRDSYYYGCYWYADGTNPYPYEDSFSWCIGSDFDYLFSFVLGQKGKYAKMSSVIRWNIDQNIEFIDDKEEVSYSLKEITSGVEDRLVDYFDTLTSVLTKSSYIIDEISNNTSPEEIAFIQNLNSTTVKSHSNAYNRTWKWQLVSIKELYILFSPFWIRSPLDWAGESIESLFKHLFVLYEIPKHLEWYVLYSEKVNSSFDSMKWFFAALYFAQGGSIKHFAKAFALHLPSKFNHYYSQVPSEMSLEEAIIHAEIKRLGGTAIDFHRITNDPSYVVDLSKSTYYLNNYAPTVEMGIFRDFWYGALNWLIKYSEEITNEESEEVLAWAMHEYTEGLRGVIANFSWKGRGKSATLNRAHDYHEALKKLKGQRYLEWKSKDWNWTIIQNDIEWKFQEILNSTDLSKEGQAMSHCVALQTQSCAYNTAAIFSLRVDDKRAVTIHISPKTGQLIESKQRFNVMPTQEQNTIIDKWLRTIVLTSLE